MAVITLGLITSPVLHSNGIEYALARTNSNTAANVWLLRVVYSSDNWATYGTVGTFTSISGGSASHKVSGTGIIIGDVLYFGHGTRNSVLGRYNVITATLLEETEVADEGGGSLISMHYFGNDIVAFCGRNHNVMGSPTYGIGYCRCVAGGAWGAVNAYLSTNASVGTHAVVEGSSGGDKLYIKASAGAIECFVYTISLDTFVSCSSVDSDALYNPKSIAYYNGKGYTLGRFAYLWEIVFTATSFTAVQRSTVAGLSYGDEGAIYISAAGEVHIVATEVHTDGHTMYMQYVNMLIDEWVVSPVTETSLSLSGFDRTLERRQVPCRILSVGVDSLEVNYIAPYDVYFGVYQGISARTVIRTETYAFTAPVDVSSDLTLPTIQISSDISIAGQTVDMASALTLASIQMVAEIDAYRTYRYLDAAFLLPALQISSAIHKATPQFINALQLTHKLEGFVYLADDVKYRLTVNGSMIIPMLNFTISKSKNLGGSVTESVRVSVPKIFQDSLIEQVDSEIVIEKMVGTNLRTLSTSIIGSMDTTKTEQVAIFAEATEALGSELDITAQKVLYIRNSAQNKSVRFAPNTSINIGDTISFQGTTILAESVTTYVGQSQSFTEVSS